MKQQKEPYSMAQLAVRWGVSTATVKRWMHRGDFVAKRKGTTSKSPYVVERVEVLRYERDDNIAVYVDN